MSETSITPITPPTERIPLRVESSFSQHLSPAEWGVDPDRQWWALACRRPRFGDAVAHVFPPLAGQRNPLVTVTLPAGDLDETESAGRYAIDVARQAVRLVARPADPDTLTALRTLLDRSGPMGGTSQRAWHNLLQWAEEARGGLLRTLEL